MDEDVQAAETLPDAVDDLLGAAGRADVSHHEQARIGIADGHGAGGGQHGGPALGQAARDGGADALTPAGDERSAAGERIADGHRHGRSFLPGMSLTAGPMPASAR